MALKRSLLSYLCTILLTIIKNLVDKCSNFTSAYAQVGAFSVIVQLHRLIVYSTTPERCVSDLIRRLCIGAAAQCR